MSTVIVAYDPFDRNSWERIDHVKDFADFLLKEIAPKYNGVFPKSARIYLESIDLEHDITPVTEIAAEALHRVEGTIYVVMWPKAAGPQILVGLALWIVPTVIRGITGDDRLRAGGSRVVAKRPQAGSPNNVPGERKNTARPDERIPDIYGRVRSTPDLLSYPYVTFQNNLQQEVSYMCVGEGDYLVTSDKVYEGDTKVSQLADTSVQVYGPGQAPGGGTPSLTIGAAITDPVYTVVPVTNVKGDVLLPINANALYADDVFAWFKDGDPDKPKVAEEGGSPFNAAPLFSYPSVGNGRVVYTYGVAASNGTAPSTVDIITNKFRVGDPVGLEWSTTAVSVHPRVLTEGDGGSGNRPNLRLMPQTPDDDHYTITAIDASVPGIVTIDFTVPTSVQSEWDKLILYNPSGEAGIGPENIAAGTVYNLASILYPVVHRQGPYFVDDPDMEFLMFNFTAPQGLFQDDGKTQSAMSIEVIIEATPASSIGTAIGPKETFTTTISGSSSSRDFIGKTVTITPTFQGRSLISVYRNTITPNRHNSNAWETYNRQFIITNGLSRPVLKPWDGLTESRQVKATVQDEIRWTHAYSMSVPPNISFGDITTVHAKTVQRKNQRADETERRLNLIVIRKLPIWNGTILTGNTATETGKNALFNVLKASHLGNLDDSLIDFNSISGAFDAVTAAFGDSRMCNFDHTFDSDKSSLEDLIGAIGESCFVNIFRQGSIIKATADVSTQQSTILFNHRNKIPNTETRSVQFGTEEDYDGTQVSYIDDTDSRVKTYIVPTAGASRNPKRIELSGVHTKYKAAAHAWRAYNEILYKNTYTEFDACDEAALTLVNDRVLIADNTRPDYQDGDITAIDGLTIYTSQTALMVGASTIFIQHVDGTTESIPVASQDTPNSLVLGSAPSIPLYIDNDNCIRPRYILVRNSATMPTAFRIQNRSYKSPRVYGISAFNYSDGYYANDGLFIWLAFKNITGTPSIGAFTDRAPYDFPITAENGVGTTTDVTRGQVYDGNAVGDHLTIGLSPNIALTSFTSYTMSCWINKDNNTVPGYIFASSGSDELKFELTGGTPLARGIHDNVIYVSAPFSITTWQHLALVYDSVALTMDLYLNGELVDSATSVPNFSFFSDLVAFTHTPFIDGLVGLADDLRLYQVAHEPEFIRSLYQKTKK